MKLQDSIPKNPPCILVEGPSSRDAAFYGRWLLAAAKANSLCEKAFEDDDFERFWIWMLGYTMDFGICATKLLARLRENFASFIVPLDEWYGMAEFIMMIEMGFCVRTGQRYQMVIPPELTMRKFKKAAQKLAQPDDEECYTHFEYVVTTMPYAEAKAWQARLRTMDENQRCADRHLLLETHG